MFYIRMFNVPIVYYGVFCGVVTIFSISFFFAARGDNDVRSAFLSAVNV